MKNILMRTCEESTMIMMIIATSFLFGAVLTNLYIAQTLAQQIVALEVNRVGDHGAHQYCRSWGPFLPARGHHPDPLPHPASDHHRLWVSIPSGSGW
ncbi:MAG: hypothetical protein U5R30_07080 [Deltaproteobacteria bacterium]|nr:hypothetical protein [Deltaproteobacteria bacterium]